MLKKCLIQSSNILDSSHILGFFFTFNICTKNESDVTLKHTFRDFTKKSYSEIIETNNFKDIKNHRRVSNDRKYFIGPHNTFTDCESDKKNEISTYLNNIKDELVLLELDITYTTSLRGSIPQITSQDCTLKHPVSPTLIAGSIFSKEEVQTELINMVLNRNQVIITFDFKILTLNTISDFKKPFQKPDNYFDHYCTQQYMKIIYFINYYILMMKNPDDAIREKERLVNLLAENTEQTIQLRLIFNIEGEDDEDI